jgi:hypothetical protein
MEGDMTNDVVIDPFQAWDSKSAVRAKTRRKAVDGCSRDSVYFNPALVPVLRHAAVIERGTDFFRNVQIFHLFRYLEYTDFIELEIVNRSVHPIMRFRLSWPMPDTMVLGAYKVYVDEGYHAEMSVNMRAQIRRIISLPPQNQAFPRGLRRVVELIQSAPPIHTDLMYIFASVVSETLISDNLKQASDISVVAPVRELIEDHFNDECVHQNYFSCLFRTIWPTLDENLKIMVGCQLPRFIQAFLMGDPGVVREDLVSLGMSVGEAEEVVAQSYGDNKPSPDILRKAASTTLALFRQNGVFAIEPVAEAFMAEHLIDAPTARC